MEMFPLFFSNLRQNLFKHLLKSANNIVNETPVQWFSDCYRQTDENDENNKQIVGIFRCPSAKDKWLRNNNTRNNNKNNNNPVKTKVIPVIIGATGTTSKSFRKYVSNITGNHEVKELQKTAILGTAHILRKVLM